MGERLLDSLHTKKAVVSETDIIIHVVTPIRVEIGDRISKDAVTI